MMKKEQEKKKKVPTEKQLKALERGRKIRAEQIKEEKKKMKKK